MEKKILAWFGAAICFLIVLGIAMVPLEEPLEDSLSTAVSNGPSLSIWPEDETPQTEATDAPAVTQMQIQSTVPVSDSGAVSREYVLNTNTGKFHIPSCYSIDQMNEENKQIFTGTRDEVLALGYEPCLNCNP